LNHDFLQNFPIFSKENTSTMREKQPINAPAARQYSLKLEQLFRRWQQNMIPIPKVYMLQLQTDARNTEIQRP
jgi:hypothetical protein